MFKKLVSNLSFSPGILSQMAYYSRRLSRENLTRQLSAIMAIGVFVFQIAAVALPPTISRANGGNNLIADGVTSQEDIISNLNRDPDLRALFSAYGVTDALIRSTTLTYIPAQNSNMYSFGRQEIVASTHVKFGGTDFYYRPLSSVAITANAHAYVGHFANGKQFAILVTCGNLALEQVAGPTVVPSVAPTVPPTLPPTRPANPVGESYISVDCREVRGRWAGHNNERVDIFFTSLGGNHYGDTSATTDSNGNFLQSITSQAATGTEGFYAQITGTGITSQGIGACNVPVATPPPTPVPTPIPTPVPVLGCTSLRGNGSQTVKGNIPLAVNFVGQEYAQNTTITTRIINFGDGSPIASGLSASHTYATAGTYTAFLSIGDAQTVTSSTNCSVTIQATTPNVCPTGYTGTPPNCLPPASSFVCVSLKATGTSGPAPLTVTFTEGIATATSGTVTKRTLIFGDGSTQENPVFPLKHTYSRVASYTASYSVGDDSKVVSGTDCSLKISATTPPSSKLDRTKKAAITNAGGTTRDANNAVASAGELMTYSLTTTNTGGADEKDFIVKEDIHDILEYAALENTGGATLDSSKALVWPKVTIASGKLVSNTFSVRVKNPIPATARSQSDPNSFDLTLTNSYCNPVPVGSTTTVPANCSVTTKLTVPTPKEIETAAAKLPATGGGSSLFFTLAFVAMTIYFYLRNRQLITEVKTLSANYHPGAS